MWKLLLLAGAAAVYYGKQKLDQLFDGLSFEPVGVQFSKNSVGLVSTRFTLNLKIFNKSNVPVPIQSVSGIAYFNKAQLANFNIQKAATIPANNNITLPVDITASNANAIDLLKSIFTNKGTPAINLKGGVFTALGTAPIDITFDKISFKPA